jgi:cell division protease FtsH
MPKRKTPAQLPKSSIIHDLNYDLWNIIRSFILRLSTGELKDDEIKVENTLNYIDPPGILGSVSITGYDSFKNIITDGKTTFSLISYKGEKYILSLIDEHQNFKIAITPEEEGLNCENLLNEITQKAISNSGYRGKILKIFYDTMDETIKIRQIPKPNITLEDIFIDESIKNEINDFINCVTNLNFNSMRYLLVGDPGTGKTDTIKAIINHCHEKNNLLTTILTDASCGIGISKIFQFAQLFKPTLICIDDIDLIIGNREKNYNPRNLSSTLQTLDGFVDVEGIYLIATTNDKDLVDLSARRPGRFDLIIKFGPIDPRFYPNVVLRETKDEKLAEIFKNQEVINSLKGVTGAFLVNLIKYLMRPRFEKKRYEIEFVISTIKQLKNAFDPTNYNKFGF